VINEHFISDHVKASDMDMLWSGGWRHFGSFFFRYSLAPNTRRLCHVTPLRIELANFELSRSQRRVLARNQDLDVVIREAFIDSEKHDLFGRHRTRFKENVPDSLYDFMSKKAGSVPCRCEEICAFDNGRLVAFSFLDIGAIATSAVYAAFEPEESKRSLGIFTMLCAIAHSRSLGRTYYYPGYAYREPSMYDYKKRFSGLQYFDWTAEWQSFTS